MESSRSSARLWPWLSTFPHSCVAEMPPYTQLLRSGRLLAFGLAGVSRPPSATTSAGRYRRPVNERNARRLPVGQDLPNWGYVPDEDRIARRAARARERFKRDRDHVARG